MLKRLQKNIRIADVIFPLSLPVIVFLIVFLFAPAYAEGAVKLHYPPDKVIMELELVNFSLEVSGGSADIIKVRKNGNEIQSITPDEAFECFAVPLNLGENAITVSVLKDGLEVFTSGVTVYRRSDLESQYAKPPAAYRKDYFHMKDFPQCTACHILDAKDHDMKPVSFNSYGAGTAGGETKGAAVSTCYSCHKKMASYPYVHGPVAVWSCLSCHDRDSERTYSVKKPDTEVCFRCHKEQKDDWESKKYTHGPVTIGKCAICHSPHASQYPYNLYKPTWDLCVNCHAEKGSGKHVLGDSFSIEGHPTKDRPDPVRIGKELSCASCHSPHASNYEHLWAFEAESIFDLCKKCHFDK